MVREYELGLPRFSCEMGKGWKNSIMKKILIFFAAAAIFSSDSSAHIESLSDRIFDLRRGKEIPISRVLADLEEIRIILVGERHNEKSHHRAQLYIIQMLHESGLALAIGLEMFRSDSQDALDQWLAGKMTEKDFKKVYYDNWDFNWRLYNMIFKYAKEQKIPMVGLNVPREITQQVAHNGFKSLTEEQRGKLSDIICRVDREYIQYIKRSFGAHGHGNLNFAYFCEAQLVWDNVMAINALEFLKANTNFTIIIIAGTGHTRKPGIPVQIRKRSKLPYAVFLPEIQGIIDSGTITTQDADYIILDLH